MTMAADASKLTLLSLLLFALLRCIVANNDQPTAIRIQQQHIQHDTAFQDYQRRTKSKKNKSKISTVAPTVSKAPSLSASPTMPFAPSSGKGEHKKSGKVSYCEGVYTSLSLLLLRSFAFEFHLILSYYLNLAD